MSAVRRFVTIVGLIGLLLGACPGKARAQCALPNLLTNGQPTDATQVMANFDAIVTCASPAGAANALQYNNGNAFGAVGPLTDGQLIIGSTRNAPQAATLSAGPGITITNGPGTVSLSATGGFTLESNGSSLGMVTTLNAAPGLTATASGSTGTLTPAVTATGPFNSGDCLKSATAGSGAVAVEDAGTPCGGGGGGAPVGNVGGMGSNSLGTLVATLSLSGNSFSFGPLSGCSLDSTNTATLTSGHVYRFVTYQSAGSTAYSPNLVVALTSSPTWGYFLGVSGNTYTAYVSGGSGYTKIANGLTSPVTQKGPSVLEMYIYVSSSFYNMIWGDQFGATSGTQVNATVNLAGQTIEVAECGGTASAGYIFDLGTVPTQ